MADSKAKIELLAKLKNYPINPCCDCPSLRLVVLKDNAASIGCPHTNLCKKYNRFAGSVLWNDVRYGRVCHDYMWERLTRE